ncbi:MAG: sugar nucleotide-binding protein [Chlamydiales bacterium]
MVHSIKPLIIGAKGFIGRYFFRHFLPFFPDLIGTHHLSQEGFFLLDLHDPVLNFPLSSYRYAMITAAISHPESCEIDRKHSYQCNVEGPIKLGMFFKKKGIIPIFFSTDYVFDGTQSLYTSDSPPSPLNEYGRQKAELEQRALDLNGLVIRLSKVYGLEKGDRTFFDEIVFNLLSNKKIRMASDQILSPIAVHEIVKIVEQLMHNGERGIFNLTGPTYASRFEMAKRAASMLGVDGNLVTKILLKDLKSSYQRPNQVNLASLFSTMPWEEGLQIVVDQHKR